MTVWEISKTSNLFAALIQELEFTFSSSPADDAKNMTEEEGWHFVNVGEQHTFGVNTAGLEDKATACQMLVCYAKELKEGFADYAEEVVKIMVPNLTFYYEDNILS